MMEESENIYDKLKEMLGTHPNNLNVLEEQIDIDLQMEYFETSRRIKDKVDANTAINKSNLLFDPDSSIEEKREILPLLASLGKIEGFRIIERFMRKPPDELKGWGALALQESKMHLESEFLDENQVFISTGLGGKEGKLRYFVVLIGKDIESFSEIQRKIIRSEFEFVLGKYKAEIERIQFSGSLASIMTVIPLNVTIKRIFHEALEEANQYGNFLVPDYIITNVKELSFEEIRDFLRNQNEDKK